jgi:spermidine synthase
MKLDQGFLDLKMVLDGTIVHSASDSLGNILVVDYPTYRVLSFDSIYEQSGFYLEKPYALVHEYTRIMMLALCFCEPRHITLLGLGGGSLLRSLHHYLSHCDFSVIELREKVYEIAKKYFDIPDDQRVHVAIQDADLFLQTSKDASTDIIFADLYDAYKMHPAQVQQQFVHDNWRTLTNNGWLVINYHQLPDPQSPFFTCLIERFSTVMVCSGKFNNHVLFAGKSSRVNYEKAPAKLKQMEDILGESFMPLFHRLKHVML